MGRTGQWFAYQDAGVEPDIMTMAKALGGGVSIGAMMASPDVAQALVPGTHASTFGGNPLACAAAIAVIEVIEEENLLDNAVEMGQYCRAKLEGLQSRYASIVQVRGRGLLTALELTEPAATFVQICWEKGLRINCTQETVLRFMPALNVTADLIDQAIAIFDEALAEIYNGASV